jgi:hypothetical protein
MYKGGINPVVPTVLGASILPVTGMHNTVAIALAVAAGLAAWAVVYMTASKLNKR